MKNPSKITPCCSKVGIKRGPWTPEEDELLSNYITREGQGRWRTLPKRAGLLRCGKSCRLRWMNYLRPSVKRGQIAPDEEDLIIRLHRLLGNRWSLIAGRIPGRTDNEIKNYWNTHLSKKLISQGLDPRTHKPLNPNPNDTVHETATAPAPAPNPNPNSSGLVELGVARDRAAANVVDGNSNIGYLEGIMANQIGRNAHENWQDSDELMMMMGLQDGGGNGNKDHKMDCCTNDVFSSFLNSLIDEDMFLKQQQQQQNMDAPSDSLASSMLGAIWDAKVPTPATVNEEECAQLADHGGNCL